MPKEVDLSYYTLRVLLVAAKNSFFYVLWLFAFIGTPIIFFGGKLSYLEKSLLWLGILVFIWLLYLSLCIVFHRMSLRNEVNRETYLSKSELDKGKAIGKYLEGW